MFSLASYKTVYDVEEVQRRLQKVGPEQDGNLRKTYERMLEAGGQRLALKPVHVPAAQTLKEELPNFAGPIEHVMRALALACDSADPVEVTPMLLLGDPGIGKTHFARRVAELLGTHCQLVPMNAMTAGWILSGSSSQWKGSKPGKVFEALVDGEYANPVVVLDEIDKASSRAQYDPLGSLYGLLEHDTAQHFTDEFSEVALDCSAIVWVATANDASGIPDPILNRMDVFEVPSPDEAGCRAIASRLYAEIRDGHDWGRLFEPELRESVLTALAAMGPREMRRALASAFGAARLAKRDHLLEEDLRRASAKPGRAIGFL